ncbi:hypothetical protein GCM10010271_50440 [Streptomyces kurssanovii]|nr:hypothetical protein GCM10010271_50440 [Streptomyces kurssanovii]
MPLAFIGLQPTFARSWLTMSITAASAEAAADVSGAAVLDGATVRSGVRVCSRVGSGAGFGLVLGLFVVSLDGVAEGLGDMGFFDG